MCHAIVKPRQRGGNVAPLKKGPTGTDVRYDGCQKLRSDTGMKINIHPAL